MRTMTRVLAVVGALALVSGGSLTGAAAAAPDARTEPLPALGALGANYNENLDQLNYLELRTARTSWVRGFYALPEADAVPPDQSETLRVMRDAHSRGYQTLLSLKFPKTGTSFPRPPSPGGTAIHPLTVRSRDGAMSTPGYAWIDDFRALQ
jgi:hypothetical protein